MTIFSFYKISNAIQSLLEAYFAIKVKVDKEVVVFFFSSWCLMRQARTYSDNAGRYFHRCPQLLITSLHFTSLHLLISANSCCCTVCVQTWLIFVPFYSIPMFYEMKDTIPLLF